jgi:Tfp pilus assembly protein PilP
MIRLREKIGRVAGRAARSGRMAVLLLAGAALALPLAAQSVPAHLNRVRRQVRPQAQTKKAAPARKPSAAAPAQRAAGAAVRPVAMREQAGRRDPFEPLVREGKDRGPAVHLPPGIAGLQIGTLRIDGLVKGPNGMIAIVANPDQRVYFLRDGDHVYDGQVEQITMTEVTFHESGKDAFGRPIERNVTRRLYSTPGEQQ